MVMEVGEPHELQRVRPSVEVTGSAADAPSATIAARAGTGWRCATADQTKEGAAPAMRITAQIGGPGERYAFPKLVLCHSIMHFGLSLHSKPNELNPPRPHCTHKELRTGQGQAPITPLSRQSITSAPEHKLQIHRTLTRSRPHSSGTRLSACSFYVLLALRMLTAAAASPLSKRSTQPSPGSGPVAQLELPPDQPAERGTCR